jgi:hypothetical protein|tara:strand:- start:455 stop:1204 length:750 start_codon:yes stop_codon:yes gene_type:complete
MTSTINNTTFAQKATMGNASQTVCHPINWQDILKQPEASFTPQTVRKYLVDVIERLNQHWGVWMDGQLMGKIRVTRNATTGVAPVEVNISTWRARQLWPQMIQCTWTSQTGEKKTLFRNVVDMFLKSRNRKELYQSQTQIQPLCTSPVIQWLRTQLSLPIECCAIKWGGLNARSLLYDSFLETCAHPEDWTPKSISQLLYRALPSCRPVTGVRVRRKGIAMMYMPGRTLCCDILNHWIQTNERQNTLRF